MADEISTVNFTEDDDVIVTSDEEEPILIPKRTRYKKPKEKPVCNIRSVNAECTSEISNIKVKPANSNLEPVASTSNRSDDTFLPFMYDAHIQSEEDKNHLLEMERLKLEIFSYIDQLMNEQLLANNVNDSTHDAFSEMNDSLLANISFNSSFSSNTSDSTRNLTEVSSSKNAAQNNENDSEIFENIHDVSSHTEQMNCNVEKLLTKPNIFKLGSVSNSAIFRTINDEIHSNECQNVELISINSLEEMFAEPMTSSDLENTANTTLVNVPNISESMDSSIDLDKLLYFFEKANQVERKFELKLNSPQMAQSFEDPSETLSVDSEDIPETTIKYVDSSSSDASEKLILEASEPSDTFSQDSVENSESDESSSESEDQIESTVTQELRNFPQTGKQSEDLKSSMVIENDSENSELNKNTGPDRVDFELNDQSAGVVRVELPGPASPPLSVQLDNFLAESFKSSKLCRRSSDSNISINVPCKETLSPGAARLKTKPLSLAEIDTKSPVCEIKALDGDLNLDCDGKVLPVDILSIFINCKLTAEGTYELDGVPFKYISFTGIVINKTNAFDNMSTFLIDDGSAVIKCRIEEFPWVKADRQELQIVQEQIERCPVVPITEEDYEIENICIYLLEKTKRMYQECPVNDDITLGDELHIVGKVYDTAAAERLVYAKYIWRENNISFRQHRGYTPGQFMESSELIDFTN